MEPQTVMEGDNMKHLEFPKITEFTFLHTFLAYENKNKS